MRDSMDMITPILLNRFRALLSEWLADALPGEAPQGLHWCLAPVIKPARYLGQDGSVAGVEGDAPPALPVRLWLGGKTVFHHPLPSEGDIHRHDLTESVVMKQGRSGVFAVVTVKSAFSLSGSVLITDRKQIAFCSAPVPAMQQASTPDVTFSPLPRHRGFRADRHLLFQYAALTMNSHRIHLEGMLDGRLPVVQGPLIATVLLNECVRRMPASLSCFEYRLQKSLSCDEDAVIDVHADGAGVLTGRLCLPAGNETLATFRAC